MQPRTPRRAGVAPLDRKRSTAIALLLALASTSKARAQSADTEPIRIRFEAHTGCPDQAAFTREVQARTARARLATEDEPARTFTVTVKPKGQASQGELTIRDVGGASSVRQVSGRACAEVVSALALIAALAIDPKASTAPEVPTTPPLPPPTPPAPPTPPVEPYFPPGAAPRGSPLVRYENPRRPELWPPIAEPLPALYPPPYAQAEPRWRFSVGGQLTAVGAVAPTIATGILVFFDLARDDPGAYAPSFRVAVTRATSGGIKTAAGTASFRWSAIRVDGCPFRLGSRELSVRPCGMIDLGALEGYGTVSALRPWVTVGVLGRVQWVILDLVQLEAQGGGYLPLVRDGFVFDAPAGTPDIPVHHTPAVGGIVGVGVGIRFP